MDSYEKTFVFSGGTCGAFHLSFRINGTRTEAEVTHFPDMIDLSFLAEIEHALNRLKIPRRLCPLCEVDDGVARYLFVDPVRVEQAEAQRLLVSVADGFGES